jgi:hypothetical protein
MHGVPADLNIGFLQGSKLIQVCLGENQIQFHFDPTGSISVEGDWELVKVIGLHFDSPEVTSKNPRSHLHRLVGQNVVATEIMATKSFSLQFDNGDVLRIFDSSEEFESFTIQPGNIFV